MPLPISRESIAALQRCAALHLKAVDFYRQGSVAYTRLGYTKLGARWKADSEEEEGHLRLVLDRLAFFWEGPEGDEMPEDQAAPPIPAPADPDFAAMPAEPGEGPATVTLANRFTPIHRDSVPEFLAAALDLERSAAEAERAGIVTARAAGDEGTAAILVQLLAGSEASILEIEGDLSLLADDQVGLDNWLANQI